LGGGLIRAELQSLRETRPLAAPWWSRFGAKR